MFDRSLGHSDHESFAFKKYLDMGFVCSRCSCNQIFSIKLINGYVEWFQMEIRTFSNALNRGHLLTAVKVIVFVPST